MTSAPVFAVVGHPNKGKSSIVATLAQDNSVQISPTPGTTVASRTFPMRVDDEVLYTLIDTPGFQRARRTFAWMKERHGDASKRHEAIRAFVDTHRGTGKFTDECELLTPLIEGAGILYVIDGSRPYGDEYEAEMEILRWTGQPSMALINLIGTGDHVDAWKAALGQYFKIVRVFDALTAEFEKRLELLRAFGQLKEQWHEPLERAVASLETDRKNRQVQSARSIAEMLADMLTLTVSIKLPKGADGKPHEGALLEKFKNRLRKKERVCRGEVQEIYDYQSIERREDTFELADEDLFSEDTWLLSGLSRRQLLTTAAFSGAIVGTGVDLAVGGASLFAGAAIGSVIGGASAWFSYDRIADFKLFGLPLGGTELRVGPVRHINFPYVVLGRALFHHTRLVRRTHAQRDALELQHLAEAASSKSIPDKQRKRLERSFTQLRKGLGTDKKMQIIEKLTQIIDELMTLNQP